MGRGKDITEVKKAAVTALLNTKMYSQRRIAVMEKISVGTVNKIAKTIHLKQGNTVSPRSRCGRKRKTSERVDRKITKIALECRTATTKNVQEKLRRENIEISTKTIRRRLAEKGIKCYRPVKRPRLTPAMKKKRLQWSQRHKHFTVEDWKKVQQNNISINNILTFFF